jgi:outer membrane immunogenic protein
VEQFVGLDVSQELTHLCVIAARAYKFHYRDISLADSKGNPLKRFLIAGIVAVTLFAVPALAADMPVKAPPQRPLPVYSWTGLYIGASAGYNWSRSDVDPTGNVAFVGPAYGPAGPDFAAAQAAAIPSALSTRQYGFIGGGQVGYNRQLDRYVLGAEVDFSGLGGRGTNSFNTSVLSADLIERVQSATSVDGRLDSLGTVRGRVGFMPIERLLTFATGGFAFGRAESSTTISQACINPGCGAVFPNPATGAGSKILPGWALGGGMEYALMGSWSVKAEYLHYDLGNMTYATTPLASTGPLGPLTTLNPASTAHFAGDVVRAGINYKFGP